MNDRQEQIIEILKEKGKVSVAELSKTLYVCEMTIRRDLRELAADGRIKRYNGGAMLFAKDTDFPFSDRKMLHSKEKARLAKLASEYVEDYSVVFIDSSSTCACLLPHLNLKKDIKIVTNSLIVAQLSSEYNIPCMMVGGECCAKDMCTVGNFAIETLSKINVDIAFFSSNAITEDGLITDSSIEQTAVRQTAMKQAERSVFAFTKYKQNRKEMYTVCHSEDVYKVILE